MNFFKICIGNIALGAEILKKKLKTTLFGHPSQKRIKEYKKKLPFIFNNLEKYKFLNDVKENNEKEKIKIITYQKDSLYAFSIKQILWDHFKITSKIERDHFLREKILISLIDNPKIFKEIKISEVENYLISNLYHQFNLYRGSNPFIVCKFIRKLEKILIDFGVFKPQKNLKIYLTIDAEAQLAYFDNKRRMSTNIFSLKNKLALVLNKTISTISKILKIPHTYFIPMELFDYEGKDPLGNPFWNVKENRKIIKNLPQHTSIAFHGFHHNEYRKLWNENKLTEEYLENEIKKTKEILNEIGIEILPINRYPSLSREPFSLKILEKNGFKIDTSDLIDDTKLKEFSGYCRYRLLKLENETISPSKVWEIPVIYADPYVINSNEEKIENLIKFLKQGENYHNSELALMFHDVIIGSLNRTQTFFNLNDGRLKITGKKELLSNLVLTLRKLIKDLREIV